MTTMLCRCHKTYERVAEKGYKSADMLKSWEMPITSMGTRKAAQWYGELFAMTRGRTSLLSYAQSAFHGENDKADQIMEKFDQISGNDSRGELLQNETIWMPLRLIPEGIKSKMRELTLLFRLWNYYVFQ
jgi:hypothetical protein